MRFGYWMPIFGGWLRNVPDEGMPVSWPYIRDLVAESEQLGFDLSLIGFSADELAALSPVPAAESKPPEEFREYDEKLLTDYHCPSCGYEWSGKPR